MSSACKPPVGSSTGRQMASRSITGVTALSRLRGTAWCWSTPRPSAPTPKLPPRQVLEWRPRARRCVAGAGARAAAASYAVLRGRLLRHRDRLCAVRVRRARRRSGRDRQDLPSGVPGVCCEHFRDGASARQALKWSRAASPAQRANEPRRALGGRVHAADSRSLSETSYTSRSATLVDSAPDLIVGGLGPRRPRGLRRRKPCPRSEHSSSKTAQSSGRALSPPWRR